MPIVTVIGIGIALLIGGAVVTESVFAIPGLGRLTVDAILRRDYPVIQGVVLLFSFVYVLVNLLIDLALHPVRPEDPVLSTATASVPARRWPRHAAGVAAAAPLPDVLPPVKPRSGFIGFLRRNPTIAIGGGLLLLMLFVAVFAPLLWTGGPDRARPGAAHARALGAVLVRHRHAGPRRLFPRALRRAGVAAGRLRRGDLRLGRSG